MTDHILLGLRLCKEYLLCLYTTTQDVTLQAGTTIGMGGEYLILFFILGVLLGGMFIYWLALTMKMIKPKRTILKIIIECITVLMLSPLYLSLFTIIYTFRGIWHGIFYMSLLMRGCSLQEIAPFQLDTKSFIPLYFKRERKK